MANKRVQLKDKSGNLLYPQILEKNIPDSAVSTAKVADKAITTAKLEESLQNKLANVATADGLSALQATVTKLDGAATVNGSVKKQIADAIAGITQFDTKVVTELPAVASAKKGVIYLIAHTHTSADSNVNASAKEIYDEYIFIPGTTAGTGSFEKIGSTDIDLSSKADADKVYTKTAADAAFLGKTAKAADSAKVNGLTVETAVPKGAKFTDTVYDDTALAGRVSTLESSEIVFEEITD